MLLYLKHLMVATPLESPVLMLRELSNKFKLLKNPELSDIYIEDQYILKILDKVLEKDSVCLDIGAHIGIFLSMFGKYAPDGHHIGVDPSAQKCSWLRKKFRNATIHDCALSDQAGEVTFYEDRNSSGYSGLTDRGLDNSRFKKTTVQMKVLDELLDDQQKLTLMKVNVNGAEKKVIEGGRRLIEKHQPYIIFVSTAIDEEKDVEFSGDDLFNYLNKELGYNIYSMIDFYYGKPALTLEEFNRARLYPFNGFKYICTPSGT